MIYGTINHLWNIRSFPNLNWCLYSFSALLTFTQDPKSEKQQAVCFSPKWQGFRHGRKELCVHSQPFNHPVVKLSVYVYNRNVQCVVVYYSEWEICECCPSSPDLSESMQRLACVYLCSIMPHHVPKYLPQSIPLQRSEDMLFQVDSPLHSSKGMISDSMEQRFKWSLVEDQKIGSRLLLKFLICVHLLHLYILDVYFTETLLVTANASV